MGVLDSASDGRRGRLLVGGLTAALVLLAAPPLYAQSQKAAPRLAPAKPQELRTNVEQALYLIRSTLITLNDANRSGNYSVLRDLAAPDFAAKNSAADLALAFADLRQRKFDLFAVALIAPQLTAPPDIDAGGILRLRGIFPTRPLQISFDIAFRSVAGQWRLQAVSITTPQAPEVPVADAAQPPARATTQAPAPKR